MAKSIIEGLKKHKILGRSGCCYPSAEKWEKVKKAKGSKRYIICNGSEGEPYSLKDGHILKYYPEYVVEGIKQALKEIKNSEAFIYLRKDYYWFFAPKLRKLAKGLPIAVIKKKGGYLAGEETVACQAIEGKEIEPRQRPPFVSESGLWECPTLVNNVETFYCAGKIARGEYKNERFFTVTGKVPKKGVFMLDKDSTVKEILEKTKNYPAFNFFARVGSEILLKNELDKKIEGLGCIIVYDKKRTNPIKLMKKWAQFVLDENCDKCAPCREGMFRIKEMISSKKLDKKTLEDIFFAMENTSFCPFGKNAPGPFRDIINKLM